MRKANLTENFVARLVSLFFLFLITLPGLMTLFMLTTGKNLDRTLKGNFDPVECPVLNVDSFYNKSFQHDFENYFHNSFSGRGFLITTYNQIRHSLFDENPQSCISDSLIYEPFILAHMGIYPYDYNNPDRFAEMDSYVNKLYSISCMLEERGKSLIVVSASSKASWFEEDIPYRYTLMPQGLGATDCLDRIIQNKDIIYLNCDRFLAELNLPCPVFYKSSHHWSRTAEIEIEKELLNIINTRTPFTVETYAVNAMIESSTPIDRDADTWELMNLWIPTNETYYTYNISVNMVPELTNICIQGDSFTTLISSDFIKNGHNGIVSNIYYDNAYYVNNECVTLIGHDFSVLDMNKIINENDIFIIVYTDYTLSSYGCGFIDALFNCLDSATGGI